MKFELDKFHRDVSDVVLLDDLRAANRQLSKKNRRLTYRSYSEVGKFSSATIATRFGSWNEALKRANISVAEEKNIETLDLLANLENVWIFLGRQPVTRDMSNPPSKYRWEVYKGRFGGWRQALQKFVEFVNEDDSESNEISPHSSDESVNKQIVSKKRRTNRNINDRMRFRILARDGFTCQSCGASPIKERGVELHVDHILPWSKGGETVEENLQTKCKKCNLGKGNAFEQ